VVDADGGEMDHAADAARLARGVERGDAFDMHARRRLARAVAHRARGIDHRVDAVKRGMPVLGAGGGRNVEAGVVRAVAPAAGHGDAFVAIGGQPRHERRTDESRAAQDEDAHGFDLLGGEKRKPVPKFHLQPGAHRRPGPPFRTPGISKKSSCPGNPPLEN
jgi:hypothetical protein